MTQIGNKIIIQITDMFFFLDTTTGTPAKLNSFMGDHGIKSNSQPAKLKTCSFMGDHGIKSNPQLAESVTQKIELIVIL